MIVSERPYEEASSVNVQNEHTIPETVAMGSMLTQNPIEEVSKSLITSQDSKVNSMQTK